MFFGRSKATSYARSGGQPDWDGQAFDPDDPRVPAPIRESVRRLYQPGDTLYFADTAAGELIEAFWLE